MNRFSIVAQSPIVLLRDFGNIMMDIQQAYLAKDVIDTLIKYTPEHFYNNFKYRIGVKDDLKSIAIQYNNENNQDLTAARQNYYKGVKEFYKEKIDLDNYQIKDKHNWINGSIVK